jgi:Tol biopolymer transport system component
MLAFALLATAAPGQPGTTERVSVSTSGEEGNDYSHSPSISADGRYVAFASEASNLVPGDTNASWDVFVRDRLLGTTERVSVSASGEQATASSVGPSINADGRFVAFASYAPDLVSGDTNEQLDIFVRDRLLGTTERVSVSSSGEQANDFSTFTCISAEGRFVAFASWASNLVPDDTNGTCDVFVRDRQLGTTERVSVSGSGGQSNLESGYCGVSISADGRFVAFPSYGSNLVPGDSNLYKDVFVRDRQSGTTERISVSSAGEQGTYNSDRPSISADGRFVAFESGAPGLVPGDTNLATDIFVHDRQFGTTELVSISSSGEQGNRESGYWFLCISADGRFVAFESYASNLVPGDTNGRHDVFVRDRHLGTTERVSVSSLGEEGNEGSHSPSISADGRFVAFESEASDLIPEDANWAYDILVRDREAEWYEVSGTVAFQDLGASAAPPSAVAVSVKWHGTPFGTYDVGLAPDGSYGLLLPAGALTLSVKHTHWLRQTVPADNIGGPADGVDFSLVNGDCFDDNVVDLRDLAQVLLRLGKQDPMTDLDEDGVVNPADLEIVLRNFGLVGDG